MNTSSMDINMYRYAWLCTSNWHQNEENSLPHIFLNLLVHLLFMKLSYGCWMFYETMCIELTGECSLKDKWLELEWFTSLNASRNSLKSMRPSLSMSLLFAKSSMESTGILELVCSLRRRQDSSNSSIETYPVEENEEKWFALTL